MNRSITAKNVVETLDRGGVNVKDHVAGIWHAPIRGTWFVSLNDWAPESTAVAVKQILGPRVVIEAEAIPDKSKWPVRVKMITTKPFASQAQWKRCFVEDDPRWDCHKWAHETPGGAVKRFRKLPIRKKEDANSSGVIVAVWLPEEVARKVHEIAVESVGPELASPAENLHVTLEYLGKKDEVQDIAADLLMSFLNFGKDVLSNLGGKPIEGTIGGMGRFFSNEPEGDPIYLSVDSRDLTRARGLFDEELEEMGIEPRSEHGFTAHITIGYLPRDRPTPVVRFDPIEVSFDTLYLALGGVRIPFPLTVRSQKEFVDSDLVETKSLTSLVTTKGEKLAPGVTRIRGDICNVHGRWGSCSAAGFGSPKEDPKAALDRVKRSHGVGSKPIKYGVPEKKGGGKGGKGGKGAGKGGVQLEKLGREEATKQARESVINEMADKDIGLSPASARSLLDFFDGKEADPKMLEGLSQFGLVEKGKDGQFRLTGAGRAAALSMGRGDLRGTLDAISSGSDRTSDQKKGGAGGASLEDKIRSGLGQNGKGGESLGDKIRGGLSQTGGDSTEESASPQKGGGGGGKKDKPGGLPGRDSEQVPVGRGGGGGGGGGGGSMRSSQPGGPGNPKNLREDVDKIQKWAEEAQFDRRVTSVLSGLRAGRLPSLDDVESGGWDRAGFFRLNPSTNQYEPTPTANVLLRALIRGDRKLSDQIFAKARSTLERSLAVKSVWSSSEVNELPDSAFLFIQPGGKKDETGRTVPRSLRHLPYRGKDGEIDLPHLRNALARIPQMNRYPGFDRIAVRKRGLEILASTTRESKAKRRPGGEGMISEGAVRTRNQPTSKEEVQATTRKSLVVYKSDDGIDRWVLFTSNPWEDQDGEFVTLKALQQDVDRWWAEGRPETPLRWWHLGDPYFGIPGDWRTVRAGPGADLGVCDFRALHGPILVESGTFKSKKVGRAISRHANELEGSLGFAHPPTEPDDEGGFLNIRSFERSLTPAKKASNPFTSMMTQSTAMKENKLMDADKIEALRALGIEPDEVLSGADQVRRKAQSSRRPLRLKSFGEEGEFEEEGDDVATRLDSLTQQLANLQATLQGDGQDVPEERFEDLLLSELTVGELQGVLNSTISVKSVEPIGQAFQVVLGELQEIKEILTSKSVQAVVDEVARMKAKIERLSARTKGIGGKVRELEDSSPRMLTRGARPAESEDTLFNFEDEPEIAQKSNNGSSNGNSPFSWLDDFVQQ